MAEVLGGSRLQIPIAKSRPLPEAAEAHIATTKSPAARSCSLHNRMRTKRSGKRIQAPAGRSQPESRRQAMSQSPKEIVQKLLESIRDPSVVRAVRV